MRRGYRSFLLRTWRLHDGQLRVVVEQIQTGERLTAASLEVAIAWLGVQTSTSTPASSPAPGQIGSGGGQGGSHR